MASYSTVMRLRYPELRPMQDGELYQLLSAGRRYDAIGRAPYDDLTKRVEEPAPDGTKRIRILAVDIRRLAVGIIFILAGKELPRLLVHGVAIPHTPPPFLYDENILLLRHRETEVGFAYFDGVDRQGTPVLHCRLHQPDSTIKDAWSFDALVKLIKQKAQLSDYNVHTNGQGHYDYQIMSEYVVDAPWLVQKDDGPWWPALGGNHDDMPPVLLSRRHYRTFISGHGANGAVDITLDPDEPSLTSWTWWLDHSWLSRASHLFNIPFIKFRLTFDQHDYTAEEFRALPTEPYLATNVELSAPYTFLRQ